MVRWVLKPVTWVACLAPAGWLVAGVVRGDLGADPVKTLTHTTGLSALVILLVTLANTPVRRLTGWASLVKLRRLTGLFAFFYAVIHLSIYAVFDHQLSVPEIGADILEHPWVLVGFSAFLILLTLAVTSPTAMVRKLGGRRWQALHRGIYLAAILAVLHFFWLVKKDVTEPLTYGAVLAALLAARLWRGAPRRQPGRPSPEQVAERIPGT
ncbi:MAG: sulfite oxidase heme-binding subunit YedZ [Gemmatimonadales bacterium]